MRFGIVAVLSGVWSLMVAEAFLRWVNPVPVVPRHVMALDSGIRGNVPNATYTHTSADFTIEIRTNAHGMRSEDDFSVTKPDGVKRIVVLGDSFGMGYEVDHDDMFTSVLVRELERRGETVELLNLSVSGHGTAEQLIMLREEGLKYDPDLVLLCWHFTDYAENVRSGLFDLKDGELTSTGQRYLPGVAAREKMEKIPGMTLVTDQSMLFWFMREWASENAIKPALAALRNRGTAAVSDENEGPRNRSPEAFAGTEYAMDLSVALLDELEQTCADAGVALVILDIPLRLERTRFKSLFPMKQAKDRLHSSVVSPIDSFDAHAGPMMYWEQSQRHFTPFGCRLVGETLAAAITEQRLLQRSNVVQGGTTAKAAEENSE